MQQPPDMTSGNLRPLSATNYTVANDEPDVRGWSVIDGTGADVGQVSELIIDTTAMKVRYFQLRNQDGEEDLYVPAEQADLDVPNKQVVLRASGSLLGGLTGAGLSADRAEQVAPHTTTASTRAEQVERLTRAEEEVRVGKRSVPAGEVRVGKHVETDHRHEDVTVTREHIRIERRPVSDPNTSAEIRASGDEIRVPITEEEVVIEKRPVVKEELIISKEQVQETRPVDVEVQREEFDIEDSRTDSSREPHAPETPRKWGER